jgi:hypothetical protein
MSKDLLKSIEKIVLPVSEGWEIGDIEIDETKLEVYVNLVFTESVYKWEKSEYKIYDFRPERKWRHLDFWQYKTYITAKVPRIETKTGIVSIEVPWANDFERITGLFEKKLL